MRVLTLLDIMMVSRDLLWELKATLRVVAWTIMRRAWRTEERRPLRKTTTTIKPKNTVVQDREVDQ